MQLLKSSQSAFYPRLGLPPVAVSFDRRDGFIAIALALVWMAARYLAVPSADIPLNDDWVYALAVRSIIEQGRFALPSASLANVFLQAYWGALFAKIGGLTYDSLRLSIAILGALCAPLSYILARLTGGQRAVSIVFAVTVVLNPIFFVLAASFMTDIPFMFIILVSMTFFALSVRYDKPAYLLIAIIVATVGVLIRQLSIALLIAYGFHYLISRKFSVVRLLTSIMPCIIGLAVNFGYLSWMSLTGRTALVGLPVNTVTGLTLTQILVTFCKFQLQLFPYISLLSFPTLVLYLLNSKRRPQWQIWCASFVALAYIFADLAAPITLPSLGNLILPTGLGPITLFDTYVMGINSREAAPVISLFWLVITGITAASSTIIIIDVGAQLIAIMQRISSGRLFKDYELLTIPIYCSAGALLVGTSLVAIINGAFYDRYLLPVVFFVTLQFARNIRLDFMGGNNWFMNLGIVSSMLLWVGLAAAGTHDYINWNKARWKATSALLAEGVSPSKINGGYEFNGFYRHLDITRPPIRPDYWYISKPDYMIASGPVEDFEFISSTPVDSWTNLLPQRVFVLRAIR